MNTIDRINLRFKSGNNTPVERAYVTAEEWQAISALVVAAKVSRETKYQFATGIDVTLGRLLGEDKA